MAIKQEISLEGVEEFLHQLERVTQGGEETVTKFRELGGENFFVPISEGAKSASGALGEHTRSVAGVTEAYHILVPLLETAGVHISDLRGFALLARAGLEGLGLAVGGALLLGLAKIEDAATRTQRQLEDLFQSKTLGGQAFEELKKSAEGVGTTLEAQAPGFEALTVAWQKFVETTRTFKFVAPVGGALAGLPTGVVGSIDNLTTSFENFFKILRAGGQDTAQANAASAAFFKTLGEGGKLTSEALSKLPTGTVEQLAIAFGRGVVSAQEFINQVKLAPIPLDKVLEALGRFGPEAQQAFDTRAIFTFNDALQEILTTLQQGFTAITGTSISAFVVSEFKKINLTLQETFEDIKAFKEFLAKPAGTGFTELGQQLDEISAKFTELRKKVDEVPDNQTKTITFKAVPPEGVTPELPGAQPIPPEVIPLPPPRPADLEAAFGPITDKAQETHDKEVSIFSEPPFGPKGILPSGDEATATFNAFVDGLMRKWQEFKDLISGGVISPAGAEVLSPAARVAAEFQQLQPLPQQAQVQPTQQSSDQIVAPFADATQKIQALWDETVAHIADTSVISSAMETVGSVLVQPFETAAGTISSVWQSIMDGLVSQAQTAVEQINAALQQIQPPQLSLSSGGSSNIALAGGGLISGPGTTTSDSILAWLSRNEFVQPAKAVQYYGLDFMEMIRQMRLPRDLFPKFAVGGMVDGLRDALSFTLPPLPGMATGGEAKSTARPLVLQIAGKGTFHGTLNAPEHVIDTLHRESIFEQYAAAGKSPNWRRS